MLESFVFILASFGQLQVLEFGGLRLATYELLMVVSMPLLVWQLQTHRKISIPYAQMILAASIIASLLIGKTLYGFGDHSAVLYGIRACVYLFWTWLVVSLHSDADARFRFLIQGSLWIFLGIGLTQYIFFPDTRILFSLGWDRHLGRLIGVWYDPNYTGVAASLIILFAYLSRRTKLLALSMIVWALTYSRASFLSLGLSWIFLGIQGHSRKKEWIAGLCALLLSVSLLPQTLGEGVRLDRTASIDNRVDNVASTINLPATYFLTGIGFNNYPSVAVIGQTNHARLPDNSLIGILLTVGVWGTGLWLSIVGRWAQHGSVFLKSALIAIGIHGMFNATWMYAPLWLLMAGLVVMDRSEQSKKYW